MTIQFEISDNLYKCLKKRIELGVASEIDMLVDKGTVIEPKTDVDCISRKDTIDWLKKVTATDGITFETGFKQILTDIKNMPSVQPKAKTGYWFIDERPESDREVICSNCKQSAFKYHELDFDYRPKFCPNCGSYNGGAK